MNFKETGFRPFYHNFCAVTLNQALRGRISGIEGFESAEYALTYGYMDEEKGLMLEVLAAAVMEDGGFGFADEKPNVRRSISIDEVAAQEFLFFPNEDGSLYDRYGEKIKLLSQYEAGEDIEKTREMDFLDDSRDMKFIDNVSVTLKKAGLVDEVRTVRIVGVGANYFLGRLVEEPNQDFGYHLGDTFSFALNEVSKGKVICVANLNSSGKITPQELEDGSMLKEAVSAFNKKPTEQKLFLVMSILRDSNVWVPCNAVEQSSDQVALTPDILVHNNENFIPVFSSPNEMGKYGEDYSQIQKPVTEVIKIAQFCRKKLAGLVLNPFSEPFIINSEFFGILAGMKSNL
ncbi:MAG: SseB family protein [Lachnospiraceae bacterium]